MPDPYSKPCLIFASMIEAETSLKEGAYIKLSQCLYENDSSYLVISGIGSLKIMQTLFSTPLPSKDWINIGIAGQIHPEIKVGELVQITHCIKYQPLFTTKHAETFSGKIFPAHSLKVDKTSKYRSSTLVSCDFPLFNEKEKKRLNSKADCVDMEGYYIAYASSQLNTRVRMFKLISDGAEEEDPIKLQKKLGALSVEIAHYLPEVIETYSYSG